MVSGVFCSSCTANFSCARIPQRGLGRTVSISLAYMFMSPLIIGSLIQLHARSPPVPTSRLSILDIAQEHWLMDSKHRHTSRCRKRRFYLEPYRSCALWCAKKYRGPRMRGIYDYYKRATTSLRSLLLRDAWGSTRILVFERRIARSNIVKRTWARPMWAISTPFEEEVGYERQQEGRNRCVGTPVR